MTYTFKNYLLPFIGVGVLVFISFTQGYAQEHEPNGGGTTMTVFTTVANDPEDFTDEEVRAFLYRVCLARDGLSHEYHFARGKLADLGESIYPLLLEEALKPLEEKWSKGQAGRIVGGIIEIFGQSKGDKSEARKAVLVLLEKFPERFSTCCSVMGNIGEPKDVTKLLSFINQDDGITLIHVLRAVAKIAAVSQIPDIEKAVAEWEKDKTPGDWQKK